MRSAVLAVLVTGILCSDTVGQALTINDMETPLIGFVDISTTGGTPIPGVLGNTTHHIVTTIGNTLFPAGDVLIGADGVAIAGLTAGNLFANMPIGTSGIPSGLPSGGDGYVVAFWDDLDVSPAAVDTTVWWQELNGVLYIMWKNIGTTLATPGQAITFEVQIFDEAVDCGTSFQFLYPDTIFGGTQSGSDQGASATVGYCSPLANAPWSYNSFGVPPGTVITIHPAVSDAVAFSSPLGPGSIKVTFITCTTTQWILAVTLNQGSFPSGWLFGLDIPVTELVNEITIGPPFLGSSTGMPDLHALGPFFGLPPVTFYMVVLGLKNGVLVGHSDAVSYTVP